MRIHDISIDGDLDHFGGRALVIQTNRGSFKTPSRALTSSEHQYKVKIPSRPPLDNNFSEIVSQFDEENWNKFMAKNGPFKSRLRTMESLVDKMRYSVKHYYPQIAPGINLDKSGLKQLFDLQLLCSDLDFISLPSLPLACEYFDKTIETFSDDVLEEKKEPLIYLDMGLPEDVFERRFSTLLNLSESDQIHAVGLVYRSYRENYHNYRILWDNRDSRILLQMSQIPREITSTSTMHLIQKMGIDLFSIEVRKPFFKGGSSDTPLEAIKRFDPDPLLFRKFREWSSKDQNLNCHCEICKNKSAGEFMEEFGERHEDQGQTFRAATRLHECYRSLDEFELSRKFIRSGELSEYFKNKQGLRASDVPISKSLFDFE
jgi:hypothetical protein